MERDGLSLYTQLSQCDSRESQGGVAIVEASPKVFYGGEASDGASPCKSRG